MDPAPLCASEHNPKCRTVKGNDCIFPFVYKHKYYTSCTKTDSVNEKAWCATKVDGNNQLVEESWEDCSDQELSIVPGYCSEYIPTFG